MSQEKLKMARMIAGLTQAQLARKIGRTQALVSMLEHGHVRPSKEIRAKLEAALDLPLDVLFEDKSDER
jgi:transcriptional regulator with XRE-family HTH domain